MFHKPNPSHISSEDAAFDLLCDLYKDEGKVKSVAQTLAKKEISSLPWTRKFVREEYRKHVKLHTTPTEIGKTALDIYHPQYKTKHLVGKELNTITPHIWADIWKSERNGWIQTEFKLPWKAKNEDKILSLLQALYLSSEESEIDANWNNFRLDILKSSLVDMYEDFSKELYDELCLKAEDFIINNCKENYLKILTKPALLFDEEREKAKILVIVTDPLIEFFGQSVVVVMDCNGVVVEIGYFWTLAARSFESLSKTDQCIYRNEKRDVEKMILTHHPRAVVIAANSLHSMNIRKYLLATLYGLEKANVHEHSMSNNLTKVTMHDVDVAKLFASSQRAKSFLPDGDVLLRTAVSLGRYIQMPLSEALGLWSDPNEVLTLFLPLDPMQKLVNQKRLEWQLENVACESVSKVGVDINRIVSHTHMQSLLRFIPGLGPAKAYFLLESIYKKFKGKLKMRAAIISKRLLTSKVYENAAGFIFIRYEERETEPLDSTRIHPEHYEMAHKIAKSALVLPDNHREDEAIAKIIRDPKKVNELELQIYADRLEQVPGRENMMMVLNFIAKELESPFFNEKKPFRDPSETDLLYLVSGESPTTLSFGKLVHCTVITSDDRQNLVVKLESGLKGSIDKSYICADREPSREEMKSLAKGLSLTARVLEVSGRIGRDNDIYFSIKLSLLPADLADHHRFLPELNKDKLDHCFEKADEDWDEKQGLEDDEYRQGQKYVPRVVNHPRFKNIGLKTA